MACQQRFFSANIHQAYRKATGVYRWIKSSHIISQIAREAADHAATLVLVHSGPAAAETALYGYEVIHPPNSPASHVCQMYSDHPGGANVANGDGSVRFVSEFINQDVWQYVSSIADGEVISSGAW